MSEPAIQVATPREPLALRRAVQQIVSALHDRCAWGGSVAALPSSAIPGTVVKLTTDSKYYLTPDGTTWDELGPFPDPVSQEVAWDELTWTGAGTATGGWNELTTPVEVKAGRLALKPPTIVASLAGDGDVSSFAGGTLKLKVKDSLANEYAFSLLQFGLAQDVAGIGTMAVETASERLEANLAALVGKTITHFAWQVVLVDADHTVWGNGALSAGAAWSLEIW